MLWEVAVEVGWNVEWREGAMGRTSSLLPSNPLTTFLAIALAVGPNSNTSSPSSSVLLPAILNSDHCSTHDHPDTLRGCTLQSCRERRPICAPTCFNEREVGGKCDDDDRREAVDVQSMPAYLQTPTTV